MPDDEPNNKDISRRGLLTAGAAAAVTTSASGSEAQSFNFDVDQLSKLRVVSDNIRREIETNERARYDFVENPSGFLAWYGINLPESTFPDPETLERLLAQHGLGLIEDESPCDDPYPVRPRIDPSVAIAVCAVVV